MATQAVSYVHLLADEHLDVGVHVVEVLVGHLE